MSAPLRRSGQSSRATRSSTDTGFGRCRRSSIRTAATQTRAACRRRWLGSFLEGTPIVDDAREVGRQLPLEERIDGPRAGQKRKDMKPLVATEPIGANVLVE